MGRSPPDCHRRAAVGAAPARIGLGMSRFRRSSACGRVLAAPADCRRLRIPARMCPAERLPYPLAFPPAGALRRKPEAGSRTPENGSRTPGIRGRGTRVLAGTRPRRPCPRTTPCPGRMPVPAPPAVQRGPAGPAGRAGHAGPGGAYPPRPLSAAHGRTRHLSGDPAGRRPGGDDGRAAPPTRLDRDQRRLHRRVRTGAGAGEPAGPGGRARDPGARRDAVPACLRLQHACRPALRVPRLPAPPAYGIPLRPSPPPRSPRPTGPETPPARGRGPGPNVPDGTFGTRSGPKASCAWTRPPVNWKGPAETAGGTEAPREDRPCP